MKLVFDRTYADVERLKYLTNKIYADGWENLSADERAEWFGGKTVPLTDADGEQFVDANGEPLLCREGIQKGSYNYTDLNRVDDAMSETADRLAAMACPVRLDYIHHGHDDWEFANIIKNGGFSNGTNNWTINDHYNYHIVNEEMVIDTGSTDSTVTGAYGNTQTISTIEGHTYFVACKVRGEVGNTGHPWVWLSRYGLTSSTNVTGITTGDHNDGEMVRDAKILVCPSGGWNRINFGIQPTSVKGDKMTVDEIMMVDLSLVFDEFTMPTLDECLAMFPSYFDGTTIVKDTSPNVWHEQDIPTPAQMVTWLGNIEKIRSAFAVYPSTPKTPAAVKSYTQANDVERIIYDVNELMAKTQSQVVYAGEIFAGEVY